MSKRARSIRLSRSAKGAVRAPKLARNTPITGGRQLRFARVPQERKGRRPCPQTGQKHANYRCGRQLRFARVPQELLMQGWVKANWTVSESGRRVRDYHLTAAGRKQLEVEVSQYQRMSAGVRAVLKGAAIGAAVVLLGLAKPPSGEPLYADPNDPIGIAVSLALLSASGLAASYIPASRALRIRPSSALREP